MVTVIDLHGKSNILKTKNNEKIIIHNHVPTEDIVLRQSRMDFMSQILLFTIKALIVAIILFTCFFIIFYLINQAIEDKIAIIIQFVSQALNIPINIDHETLNSQLNNILNNAINASNHISVKLSSLYDNINEILFNSEIKIEAKKSIVEEASTNSKDYIENKNKNIADDTAKGNTNASYYYYINKVTKNIYDIVFHK